MFTVTLTLTADSSVILTAVTVQFEPVGSLSFCGMFDRRFFDNFDG